MAIFLTVFEFPLCVKSNLSCSMARLQIIFAPLLFIISVLHVKCSYLFVQFFVLGVDQFWIVKA